MSASVFKSSVGMLCSMRRALSGWDVSNESACANIVLYAVLFVQAANSRADISEKKIVCFFIMAGCCLSCKDNFFLFRLSFTVVFPYPEPELGIRMCNHATLKNYTKKTNRTNHGWADENNCRDSLPYLGCLSRMLGSSFEMNKKCHELPPFSSKKKSSNGSWFCLSQRVCAFIIFLFSSCP